MGSMTELRTERLILRRARPDDVQAMHGVLSDEQAMRYWSNGPHTEPAETERWLDSMITSPRELGDDFLVTLDGEVIGKMGAWRLPEFGFIIARALGRGFAAEAFESVPRQPPNRRLDFSGPTPTPQHRRTRAARRPCFIETGRAAGTWTTHIGLCDSVYLELRHEDWVSAS